MLQSTGELWTTELNAASNVPLSVQLASALRSDISAGRLPSGSRLPSTRVLSKELGVSRSTVVNVFEQLAAEGFIDAKAGSGFYVPAGRMLSLLPPRLVGRRRVSNYATLVKSLAPSYPQGPARPFDLGFAHVDGTLLATLKRITGRVLSGRRRLQFFYGTPQGDEPLREAIASYLSAARSVRCHRDQIIVTTGTLSSLSLAARLLLNPGDPVWVEDPGFHAALGALRAASATLVPVPVDEFGIDVRAGRQRCDDAAVAYVTPSHQFPLGGIMPVARRRELLDWANERGAWIFEDDYDSEFHYRGRVVPSLQGLDAHGRVLYFGTFSKVVFPSLRLGYAVIPDDLVDVFKAARQLTDRHSSGLMQAVMVEFIGDGHLGRHLKRIREVYADQQRELLSDFRSALPLGIDVQAGDRGMHLILWLPPTWSDCEVAAELAGMDIVTRPISSLSIESRQRPGLVLGHTGFDRKQALTAVEKMAGLFRRKLKQPPMLRAVAS